MPEHKTSLPAGSRVLVTGGSGFIGTNLVEYYSSQGFPTLSLDIAAPRNPEHRPFWRSADLTKLTDLTNALADFQPTHVLHFGARTDLGGAMLADYSANTLGTTNVIEAANRVGGIEHLVLASSMLVCRFGYFPRDEFDCCPATVYGQSKALGEELVRKTPPKASWTIVRPTSIWGPWFGSPYRDFFAAVKSERYVHTGHRGALQTYGYVGNTVFEVDRIAGSGARANAATLYLGDWPELDMREWANLIAENVGRRRPRTVPIALLRAAARAGDVIDSIRPGAAPITSFRLANMTTDNRLDLSGLKELVGESLPWTLEQGVKETLDWIDRASLQ